MRKSNYIIRHLLLILLVLATASSAQSQTSGTKTLLWEISGNGLEKSSYLFGTIHIMPKNQFEPFEIADEKLRSSDQMVLEIAIDVPFSVQMQWAKMLMLPEGESLKDYMDEEEFSRFKSFLLDSLDVKEMMFNAYLKMKPFAVYSALIPEIIGKKLEGYEMHYSKIAKKEDIPVKELETFEFQLAIFDSIPAEKQVEMFLLDNDTDLRSSFDEMLDLYKNQDIYKMASSLKEDSKTAEFEEELLIMRNHDWVPKISSMIHENSSFIAVGAAHLAGEHGLIKLLREEGYKVEPVMLKEEY